MTGEQRRMGAWTGALAAVLVAQAVIIAMLADRSGFFFDDFVAMWGVPNYGGFGIKYLLAAGYDHFAPGQRFLQYVAVWLPHGDWRVVTLALALGGMASTLSAWWLAKTISGSPAVSVWLAAVVGLSPLWATAWMWWTCGADYLISIPAQLLAFGFVVRRTRGGTWRDSVGASLMLAAVLACRERGAIIPGAWVLWSMLTGDEPLSVRSISRRLWSHKDLWAGAFLMLAIYVGIHLHGGYILNQLKGGAPKSNSAADFFGYLAHTAQWMAIPSLFGLIPYEWSLRTALEGACLFLFSAVVGASVVSVKSGWRPWVFLVVVAFVSQLPVAIGRGGAGDMFAREPRYSVELLPFFCVAVSWLVTLKKTQRLEAVRVPRWLVGAGTALFITVYGTLSYVSMSRYVAEWIDDVAGRARSFRLAMNSVAPNSALLESSLPAGILLTAVEDNYNWAVLSLIVQWQRPDVTMWKPTDRRLTRITPSYQVEVYEVGDAKSPVTGFVGLRGDTHVVNEAGPIGNMNYPVHVLSEPWADDGPVLLKPTWTRNDEVEPNWIQPIEQLPDGQVVKVDQSIPTQALTAATAGAIFKEPKGKRLGFEIPAGWPRAFASFDVLPLRQVTP